jgi:hypothetical protein
MKYLGDKNDITIKIYKKCQGFNQRLIKKKQAIMNPFSTEKQRIGHKYKDILDRGVLKSPNQRILNIPLIKLNEVPEELPNISESSKYEPSTPRSI